jgi:pyrimidine operon attenuation protein/uracil phosphoribosyltransferase
MTDRTLILDPARLDRVINRMAWQVLELNSNEKEFHLAGISKSGYKLAEKLLICLNKIYDGKVILTEISINKKNPSKGPTICKLSPQEFEGKSIVVVDDVLNSGGTLIYAVNYFLQARIERLSTAVLIDRNHKKYPIKADIKGVSLSTSYQDRVEVNFESPSAVYLV